MPKRNEAAVPRAAILTPEQMRNGIVRLERRVTELKKLDVMKVRAGDDPTVTKLGEAIEATLAAVFGAGTHEYQRLVNATQLDDTHYVFSPLCDGTSIADIHEGISRGRDTAVALLQSAIDHLKEELELLPEAIVASKTPTPLANEVFVVHGHDDAAREEMARFIGKAGLVPIILHEKASGGMTVIEKLEHYSDVGFAVVLLTPDDIGGPKGTDLAKLQPRARQNVIAELFYFLGKLKRARVCALKKGDIEIPSDIGGVVYIALDAAGAWKQVLLRELEEAGYTVDWGRALR
jgi:predicted nucleotide-binding protein